MLELLHKILPRAAREHALFTWLRDAGRMRRFVAGMPGAAPAARPPRRVAVVLAPWSGSEVPWFSMAFGLLLAARGSTVTFILDDMPFGSGGKRWKLEIACIRSVLKAVRRRHRVVELSAFAPAGAVSEASRAAIARLAHLNMVWTHRGESKIPAGAAEAAQALLETSDGRIAAAVKAEPFDVLFVPGGVWGTSGLWIRHARAAGARVASYDSGGYHVLLLAVNGIACQLQDIPRSFALLKEHAATGPERSLVTDFALGEIGKRRAGTDKFASQVQSARPKDPRFTGAVLIALNSSWDSAALGLHAVFPSTQEWIVETTRYVLANTQAPVVVRQHPVERLPIGRSNDDYGALLRQHFGDDPRVHFIAAADPVNSYDLLEQACAVVTYTSTIGVEAAVQGKMVVTESSSYYADLGFVLKATTAEQYFQHLSDAVSGRRTVTAEMQADAVYCYYITQCCNWVKTPFTVPDFPQWSLLPFSDLAQDRSVRSVLEAVETDTPISFLNHLHRLAEVRSAAQPVLQP